MSELTSFLSSPIRRRNLLPELSLHNVSNYIEFTKGTIDPKRVSLFANFRDEIYFCDAFFNHYRRIGVEQFLIFDDRSSDGTDRFLSAQPDCVIFRSSLTYGQRVLLSSLDGKRKVQRAGVSFKSLIPHLFFNGSFVLNVDADEFLLMPSEACKICDVLQRLEGTGSRAMISPLVEFFPSRPSFSPDPHEHPTDLLSLFNENQYFLPSPTVNVNPNGAFDVSGMTKSEELFQRFSVKKPLLRPFAPQPKSPKIKIPIIKHEKDSYRIGSHQASAPVSPDIILPIAHFVFTPNFFGKIERVVSWRSHSQNSSKYQYYQQLVEKMKLENAGFLTPSSRIYCSTSDLIEAGLMKWP